MAENNSNQDNSLNQEVMIKYMYDSMIRTENKVDDVKKSVDDHKKSIDEKLASIDKDLDKKLTASEVTKRSVLAGAVTFFLSMITTGHILPEEIPNMVKSFFHLR